MKPPTGYGCMPDLQALTMDCTASATESPLDMGRGTTFGVTGRLPRVFCCALGCSGKLSSTSGPRAATAALSYSRAPSSSSSK